MLTPGEIVKGQWVILHEDMEKDQPWMESQPDIGTLLFGVQSNLPGPVTPHIVLGIQLPYVVVYDVLAGGTRIWDTRKVSLMELKSEFVISWSPDGYAKGLTALSSLSINCGKAKVENS